MIGRAIGVGVGALWLAAAIIFGAGVAKADSWCDTSRMSGMTFYTCHYSGPWRPATVTTCVDRSGYCTTRED